MIIMEIHVKSKSAPDYTWFHGSNTVRQQAGHISFSMEKEGTEEYVIIMEIRNPAKEDGGMYKCAIRNAHGEINANLNLNIAGAPAPSGEAPSFVEKPKIRAERDGKLIIMECKVKANPQPSISWYREGVTVLEGGRIKQTVRQEGNIYHIKLELSNPELTDAGVYKCNVKNSAGESNANLTLNIERKLVTFVNTKYKLSV